MYDSHIFCKEYKDLKDQIVDIVNGDTEDYDIHPKSCIYKLNSREK